MVVSSGIPRFSNLMENVQLEQAKVNCKKSFLGIQINIHTNMSSFIMASVAGNEH